MEERGTVSERELSAALQRAILAAIKEVLPRGAAIPATVYADCLIGLYLSASPPGSPEDIEQLVATFRQRLEHALVFGDIQGHA